MVIKRKLNQMSTMIEGFHDCFEGILFSGFVRMGQEGPLEMITTCKVCTVSNKGHDVNCSTKPLTFNSCRCLSQASMEALVHVVSHSNERYEANRLGWRGVISSANDLFTHHDLERFAALCNDGHDAVEGEYYLYEHWQSSFLGCPSYIWIRNGVEGHEEVEGSNDESWGGSVESTGGREYFLVYHQWIAYTKWLLFHPDKVARYRQFKVCVYASFLHCLVLFFGY
jgi:hypothetical protein